MPLLTRAPIRPKVNLRLLIVAAALAFFASGLFALNQAPSAEAAGPTQPTQSQAWNWGNNWWGNKWWSNNNWWRNNNWYNNCGIYWYSCNNYNFGYNAFPYQYQYPTYNTYPTYNYGYSFCGNNPAYYSYPTSFTCPISPLNVQIWSPWWGYPGYYIP